MKKWLSMFLAAVMLCGVLAGCGGTQSGSTPASGAQSASAAGDSNVNAEGFPIVNEPITLRGMVALNANVKDWNEHPALKRMEELTGIHIEWECVPDAGFTEKRNLAFASDDLPDIILRAKISPQEEMKYAANGQLVALDEYLDYAPNLSALIEQDDAIRKGITMPDGHIYSCPQLNKTEGNLIHHYWINKTWLDEVGKEVPTTVDEWVDCLKAFRDGGDLNGNGAADEIPMATWFGATDTFGSYNMFYRFTGAFGCADSYCGGNAYADHLRLIDDKVTFTAQDEAFRKTAEFFNMLYNEGLIWNGSFEADESASYKSSLIKEEVARIGCFGTWTDQEITNLDVHDEYVAIPRLQGEAGMTGFENNYSELQDSSNTAITTSCKFPHVVAKFVDYMVGDPAISIQSNWGAEGYNYVKDDNGILRTPLDEQGRYVAQTEYTNFGEARVNSTTCRGSMIVLDEYYETVAGYAYDAVQLLENQKTNGKEDIMAENDTIPRVMMTTDELSRLAQIQPTISDIVDRYINQWVTGGVTDDNWNAYLGELQSAGVEELVSIYQSAVDRSSK